MTETKHQRYYRKNKEKVKAKSKAWREANPDRHSENNKIWREANPDRHSENNKIWLFNNVDVRKEYITAYRPVRNAVATKYRVAKNSRIPSWADLDAIKQFYINCPENMTVDHIIPLQGKLVSGLHVINNLQYLPGSMNWSKGNKFKVE